MWRRIPSWSKSSSRVSGGLDKLWRNCPAVFYFSNRQRQRNQQKSYVGFWPVKNMFSICFDSVVMICGTSLATQRYNGLTKAFLGAGEVRAIEVRCRWSRLQSNYKFIADCGMSKVEPRCSIFWKSESERISNSFWISESESMSNSFLKIESYERSNCFGKV